MESCVKRTELIMEEEEEQTAVRSIKIKKTGSRAQRVTDYETESDISRDVYQDFEYITNVFSNSYDGDDEVFLDDASTETSVRKPRTRRISDVIDSIGDSSPSKDHHFFPDYLTVQSPLDYQNPVPDSTILSGCNSTSSVSGATIGSVGSPPVTPSSDFGYVSGSGGSASGSIGFGGVISPPTLLHYKPIWSCFRTPCSDQTDIGIRRAKWGDHTDAKPTSPPQQTTGHNEIHSTYDLYKYNMTVEARMPVRRDSEEYNMSHPRRGLAIIFNNEEFRSEPTRKGSDYDVSALQNTYQLLGFEVEVHNNLELDKLRATIANLAQQDYTDCDCLVVTVLTHGVESNYLHARDVLYRVGELWQPFTPDRCPTLAGKPKLFFIQACRGQNFDSGVRLISNRTQTDGASGDSYKIPKMADFLIVFSTVEGFYSWRNPENGTWFIQTLCRVLSERHETTDVLKMMTMVCRSVAVDYESYNDRFIEQHQQKQVPSVNSTLIRDIYFRPKV
ncbi:caspase-1-like isoform X2 [Rhodnius prolixus]|uniref:caspase-1-like isoform X2 n=1 Tax=Rhodnius prolixus TaxID=13249 RepID=UPI003D18A123